MTAENNTEPGKYTVHLGTGQGIAIGDHAQVIQYLVQGIRRLPTDYAARIARFLAEYLGTPERPVPFGGREAALNQLDAWRADPDAPPYLLLAAPAGRGKSALLVRWLQRVQAAADPPAIVFYPVSIRFNTNLASTAFASLAARLAHLHGEEVEAAAGPAMSADLWRGVVGSYLNRPLPDGRPLLLVLDGADEAADWEPGPDLFPAAPPPGLRIVVAARYRAGETDAGGWLRTLGWERPDLARTLDLAPLTRRGVADVLTRMGFPLDVLGARVDIVDELHRLSGGDPLLVRLYVDDLWARGEAAARLQPEDLRGIEPGYEGYFARWWADQRKLWGDRAPLKERAVQTVLNLLACALGPLLGEDLLALAEPEGLTTWTLEEALRPLARFVIGDGRKQGYAFQHPKLGDYFYGRLTRRERRAWEDRFLAWGRETLEALEAGSLPPAEAPAYAVRYYGAHLQRAGAGAELLYALVSEGWLRAWEALEGTYAGFLADVERAWARAEAEGDVAVQVRCALCRASVAALSANIPPELLAAAVEKGVLLPQAGLAYARLAPEPRQRAEALAGLAPHLPEPLRGEALREALAAAREDKYRQAYALAGLAPHLPEGLLREALAAAREIRWPRDRAKALAGLAPHLPEGLLREAWAAAREIPDDIFGSRAKALAGLAPHLPEELLREALAAAREIESSGWRADALAGLAPHLPEAERVEALREALAAAREIESEWRRADALAALVPHLPEAERREALREALAAAREIEWAGPRARALAGLAPHLPEELLREALAAAQEIRGPSDRAYALEGLVPRLAELGHSQEALAAARGIGWPDDRAKVLAGLAPHLPEGLLGEALAAAREIPDDFFGSRARALSGLASHLPEGLLGEALAAAREIESSGWREEALSGLASRLAELGYPQEALAAAREIEQEGARAETLSGLAPHLPEPKREKALREAWAAAREIGDADDRAKALSGLAPYLPEGLLREAWAAAREIGDADDRAKALAGLAPYLPEGLLREAWAAAREIRDAWARAYALAGLAPHLPEGLLGAALAAAREIRRESARAEALVRLAPHLPEGLLGAALAAAREIGDADDRAKALAALAPHLPEGLLGEALAAAREIRRESARAEALVRLAPHLPEGLLREAWAAAREIESSGWARAKALSGLAPHLPEGLLGEALAAAREIGNADDRAEALAGLVPHLPEPERREVLREALAAAREIRRESARAYALAGLAPHLPDGLLQEALAAAREIEDEYWRAKALAEMAPRLAEMPPATLFPLWQETLRRLAARRRKELLSDLRALAPVLAALGGEEAVGAAFRAVQDVGRWWP